MNFKSFLYSLITIIVVTLFLFGLSFGFIFIFDKKDVQAEKIQNEKIVIDKIQAINNSSLYCYVIIKANGKFYRTNDLNLYYKYNIGDTIKETLNLLLQN